MELSTKINGKEYRYKKPVLGIPSKAQRIRSESDALQNIEVAYGNRMSDEDLEARLKPIDDKLAELESKPVEEVRGEIASLNESKRALMEAHRLGKEVFDDWWNMVTTIIQDPGENLRLEKLADSMTEGELQSVIARFFTLRTEDIQEASAIMTRHSRPSE